MAGTEGSFRMDVILPRPANLKGIEESFKYLRRLIQRGSEGGVVSLDRCYQTVVHACRETFGNVFQARVAKVQQFCSGRTNAHRRLQWVTPKLA